MNHVGKRYVAVNGLGPPVEAGEGEEFTVTAAMVAGQATNIGDHPLVDFDVLLAIGAITPIGPKAAAPKPEAAAGGS